MPKKSARKVQARKKVLGNKKTSLLSQKFVFLFLGSAVAVLLAVFGLKIFDSQPFCANSISCIKDLSGKFEPKKTGEFQGRMVTVPSQEALSYVNPAKNVLGTTAGPKKIAIDLTRQHLYAYEGDTLVMNFPVSTGKWYLTPTGSFNIWIKLRYTRMKGGSGADFYDLPNVPNVMFFANSEVSKSAGYGIHGAYWHNNFGHPMSHGCVNMRIADSATLFAWADPPTTGWSQQATDASPGTQVIISGATPVE